jgi:4-hydroxythreonine-4-phosphate dehydrogenase
MITNCAFSKKVILGAFMQHAPPIIGITMGDPVGIGPEIILQALQDPLIYKVCRPLVLGDIRILESTAKCIKSSPDLISISDPQSARYIYGKVDVMALSELDPDATEWGRPDRSTGNAMVGYITAAIEMAMDKKIDAMVTCPINKIALKLAGSEFHGHTEMLATKTNTDNYAMMFSGSKLRVVLATIHEPLSSVPSLLTTEGVVSIIELTKRELSNRFNVSDPHIAVAGLNPHAGEDGLFGDEEKRIIEPAIKIIREKGIRITGPVPPDTLFFHAVSGPFDAVICMYHDQGLIPFKMVHFTDGVNITIGLPIIRTSVDHGTAYDIAGTGKADTGSLIAAILSAADQAVCIQKRSTIGKNKSINGS